MRVLLINPHYPITEIPSPPLGLAFLAAVLERAGVEVEVLDFVVFPYSLEMLQSELEAFLPDIVGLTSVTMNFHEAARVLKDVKRIKSDIFTIMGGPHVTFCPQETMMSVPELDCVVLGEGEEAIVELIRAIERGCDLRSIKGIVCRANSRIHRTEARKGFVDLDALPLPARHLLPLGRYRALGLPVSMTTSRACPFKCIFCAGQKMFGHKVRTRNIDAVANEFEMLSKLNFDVISIADDLFTAKKKHCMAVCDEIISRKIEQNWTSFARVDTVSRELLDKMKEAGCRDICFGVETGNAEILKTINKGTTIDQVVTAVAMCKEAGINPIASFILGLPGETPETLQETLDFALKLKGLGAGYGFHLLAPFPGTKVREESDKYGIKILTNDWTQYHANRAIVETPSANRKMLDEIVVQWETTLTKWREVVRAKMKRGEAAEEDVKQLQWIEHKEEIYNLMMSRAIEEKGTWPAETSLEFRQGTEKPEVLTGSGAD
ncbi:MAG: B12-binding domain-containing radical SAM protein [Deltaproteobacteria bacterium]|nr:B12-binding domain-containing radical SAM protein [Deltaproteobacteria bacterium]